MDLKSFKATLEYDQPPVAFSVYLKGLWYDAKGDWEMAHDLIDGLEGKDAAWIHAYLHRAEGDNWNAGYWYRQAGKRMPTQSLIEEWNELVKAFLKK